MILYFYHNFIIKFLCKNSSGKYYQYNKERQQKKAHERYQIHYKEEKEKKVTIHFF